MQKNRRPTNSWQPSHHNKIFDFTNCQRRWNKWQHAETRKQMDCWWRWLPHVHLSFMISNTYTRLNTTTEYTHAHTDKHTLTMNHRNSPENHFWQSALTANLNTDAQSTRTNFQQRNLAICQIICAHLIFIWKTRWQHMHDVLWKHHTHTHTHNSESLRSDMPPGWILPSRIIRTTTHTSINCTMRKHCM